MRLHTKRYGIFFRVCNATRTVRWIFPIPGDEATIWWAAQMSLEENAALIWRTSLALDRFRTSGAGTDIRLCRCDLT